MRLPHAPLLEVVFELRWRVERTGDLFGYDPGFAPFSNAFAKAIAANGYSRQEVTAIPGPTLVQHVAQRFRKEQAFPLMQIGHGIFACNISTDYDWPTFRSMISEGVELVLKCYPDTHATPLTPEHLELRYIDVFNEELLGSASWQAFISTNTKMKFDIPDYLKSVTVQDRDRVNFGLKHGLKDAALGQFELQMTSGMSAGKQAILVTSRVVKSPVDAAPPRSELASFILKWAEDAHDVTHNFFPSFVSDSLMAKFKGE